MLRYSVAGLRIGVSGDILPFFKERMAGYLAQGEENACDIHMKYIEGEPPYSPPGELIANVNQRFWVKTEEGGYAFYDSIPEVEPILSLIVADKDWQNIRLHLHDIEPITGISTGVRSFNALGEVFKFALLKHGGIALHSSAILHGENGVVFSAPSGTGKSTHANLWRENFGATIVNDDMPAIKLVNGAPHIFGTPWSGKTNINQNIFAPLLAIVFLRQSPVNTIKKLSALEALPLFLNEIRLPAVKELMSLSLDMADKLLKEIPAYLLSCTATADAAKLVKTTLGI